MGVEKTVIERIKFDEDAELLVARAACPAATGSVRGVWSPMPGL